MEAPGEEIKKEIEEQIREESKASAFAKWVHRHSRAIFSLLAIVFAFSVFFLFNPEYTAKGMAKLGDMIVKVHKILSEPRFSIYKLVGLLIFIMFMALMVHESAKARTIIIMPARNPENTLYVRVKPLVGLKLPFTKETQQKIKPKIIENLGEMLVERQKKEIEVLKEENRILRDFLMTGWEFSEKTITPIKERYDKLFEDSIEKIEKIGKLFVTSEAEKERTARKILSLIQDKKLILEDSGEVDRREESG